MSNTELKHLKNVVHDALEASSLSGHCGESTAEIIARQRFCEASDKNFQSTFTPQVAKSLLEEVENLKEQLATSRETLKAWFDIATKTEAEATDIIIRGLKGYVRTAKNGGMPSKRADDAMDVLEDYCRLYVGIDLVPVIRGIAEAAINEAKSREMTVRETLERLVDVHYGDRMPAHDDWEVARTIARPALQEKEE